MFFFDNELNVRIEKFLLDGKNRVIIVYKGLFRVFIFIVDIVGDKLYWLDYFRYILESSNYDGLERIVIRWEYGVEVLGLVFY